MRISDDPSIKKIEPKVRVEVSAQFCGELQNSCSGSVLWAINGGRLLELHRDWAVIELAANGSRHVFERRRVDAGKVRLPWIGRGRRRGKCNRCDQKTRRPGAGSGLPIAAEGAIRTSVVGWDR
jgi:hypothetical protein